ncbi:MAG: tRNA (adenosine(37)-N6)-threonylcarbamoyltransferase complex transferase subunit TsaD [Candidatus Omnitrophota bacterium]|nr:MAG: tRNA (adenosine(37)-N6)-threonylcarbamoyltransferase complex transferase subunit TsaD [Candidatus Omnitrophota bacterium]
MIVLGIETSCDETASSVVKNGKDILSNEVSSSLNFHKKYGGIVPEIAFRKQLETIAAVTDCALKEAGLKIKDIDLISVTNAPGLLGSLLVGISFAKALSLNLGIPLVGVNHLHGHIYANFLEKDLSLPAVSLIVSGGHTSLFYLKDFKNIQTLGTTFDDACGEAFDKVAKILNLGYPGGPIIERLAKRGSPKIKFSCSNPKKPLDFSFSGIKTAVLYYARKHLAGSRHYSASSSEGQSQLIYDVCASFQEAAINTLIEKSFLACKLKKSKKLLIGGGVAANSRLRERFRAAADSDEIKVFFPQRRFCLDNAAMVAGIGYALFKKGRHSDLYLSANLN